MAKYVGRRRKLTRRETLIGLGAAGLTSAAGIVAADVYTRAVNKASEPPPGPEVGIVAPRAGSTKSKASIVPEGTGYRYYFHASPEEIGPVPFTSEEVLRGASGFEEWAKSRGGFLVDFVSLSLTARSQVTIQDVRIRVVSRGKPTRGVSTITEPHGGGDFWRELIVVDLDVDPPAARREGVDKHGNIDSESGVWDYPVSVGDDDLVLITIEPRGDTSVKWVVDVDFIAENKEQTMTVDDNGRPFEIIAIEDRLAIYNWNINEWDMVPQGRQ